MGDLGRILLSYLQAERFIAREDIACFKVEEAFLMWVEVQPEEKYPS